MKEVWLLYVRDLDGTDRSNRIYESEEGPAIFLTREEAEAAAKELAGWGGSQCVRWPTETPENYTDEFQYVFPYHTLKVYWGVRVELRGKK